MNSIAAKTAQVEGFLCYQPPIFAVYIVLNTDFPYPVLPFLELVASFFSSSLCSEGGDM